MFEKTLREMRQRIRTRRYIVTLHAVDEMDDDGLTVFDVETIIITGRIVERQQDRMSGDWKYLISGDPMNAQPATVVARLGATGTLVLVTVYREETE